MVSGRYVSPQPLSTQRVIVNMKMPKNISDRVSHHKSALPFVPPKGFGGLRGGVNQRFTGVYPHKKYDKCRNTHLSPSSREEIEGLLNCVITYHPD